MKCFITSRIVRSREVHLKKVDLRLLRPAKTTKHSVTVGLIIHLTWLLGETLAPNLNLRDLTKIELSVSLISPKEAMPSCNLALQTP